MHVTVDTNFYDAFAAWPEASQKQAVETALQSGMVQFSLSLESLEESMGLCFDQARLTARAQAILSVLGPRILARPEDIVASELRGRAEPFVDDRDRDAVRAVLDQIVGGHVPASAKQIASKAEKLKSDSVTYYRGLQSRIRGATDEQRAKLRKTTYEEFHDLYWRKQGENYLLRIAEHHGCDDPAAVARAVLAEPARFPHTTALLTMISRQLHRYLIADRRVEDGDAYDARQLIYLVDLDGLVSDDARLRERVGEMYAPPKRAMRLSEFMVTAAALA